MKINELKTTIETLIKNGLPFLVKGSPGIGKTSVIEQVCDEQGVDLLVCHPVVCDPTDFKGLGAEVNGQAEFLPFGDLRTMMNAEKPLVVFFDDLGQSLPSVQASIMQLVLKREINGKKISDQVVFCCATNGTKDKAGVKRLLQPLLSRQSTILTIETDVDQWVKWAIDNQMPVELIAFIKFQGLKMLDNFDPNFVDETGDDMVNQPCPRTVANVGKLYKAGLKSFEVIAGAVGQSFAVEFLAFCEVWQKLGNLPRDIYTGKGGECPTEPTAIFALVNALGRHSTDQVKFKNISDWMVKNLPAEFGAKFVTDIEHNSPEVVDFDGFVELNLKFLSGAFTGAIID